MYCFVFMHIKRSKFWIHIFSIAIRPRHCGSGTRDLMTKSCTGNILRLKKKFKIFFITSSNTVYSSLGLNGGGPSYRRSPPGSGPGSRWLKSIQIQDPDPQYRLPVLSFIPISNDFSFSKGNLTVPYNIMGNVGLWVGTTWWFCNIPQAAVCVPGIDSQHRRSLLFPPLSFLYPLSCCCCCCWLAQLLQRHFRHQIHVDSRRLSSQRRP